MRSKRIIVLALPVLAAGLMLRASAQPTSNPTWSELARLEGKVRDVVVAWLATDCEASERTRLLDEIATLGPRVVPALREAFALGPPPEVLAETRKAAATAYEARQAWLRAEGEASMSVEEVRRLLTTSVDDYAARQARNADRGWRERALVAMGAAGGNAEVSELERLANEPDGSYAAAAKRALEARGTVEKPKT